MVVNQASIAGLPGVCQPFIGSYSASKTAVLDLSNTLRVELGPFDIKVRSSPHSLPLIVMLIILPGHRTHHWRCENSFLGQYAKLSCWAPGIFAVCADSR